MTDEAKAKGGDESPKPVTVTRKDLVARVQTATGVKLKDVQVVVQSALTQMIEALKAGEHLRLPPFGAIRVLRAADSENSKGMRIAVREIQEKPKKAERNSAANAVGERSPAKPKTARPARATGAKKRPAAKGKQALAAKGEAE